MDGASACLSTAPRREEYMTGLFSELIDYMEEEDWKYEILEGETIIRFHFKGSAGRLLCYGDRKSVV